MFCRWRVGGNAHSCRKEENQGRWRIWRRNSGIASRNHLHRSITCGSGLLYRCWYNIYHSQLLVRTRVRYLEFYGINKSAQATFCWMNEPRNERIAQCFLCVCAKWEATCFSAKPRILQNIRYFMVVSTLTSFRSLQQDTMSCAPAAYHAKHFIAWPACTNNCLRISRLFTFMTVKSRPLTLARGNSPRDYGTSFQFRVRLPHSECGIKHLRLQ